MNRSWKLGGWLLLAGVIVPLRVWAFRCHPTERSQHFEKVSSPPGSAELASDELTLVVGEGPPLPEDFDTHDRFRLCLGEIRTDACIEESYVDWLP
jgi:hypothetical protein